MGLISSLILAPLLPVRGVVWVAEQVSQEAERRWSDPATIQRELAEVELLLESGDIDDAEAEALEEALLARLGYGTTDTGLRFDPEGGGGL